MALVEVNANGVVLSPWLGHKFHALLVQRGFRDKHGPYTAVMSPERAKEWSAIMKEMAPAIHKHFAVTVIPPKEISNGDGTVRIERFPADVIEFHGPKGQQLGMIHNLGPIGEQHA